MTWTKLTDTFSEEFEELGPEALALQVAALCYSNRLLTDGHIPGRKARTLFPLDNPDQAIQVLVEAGHWVRTDEGFQVADFLEDQRSRETVLRERQHRNERQKRYIAKARGLKTDGDASTNASNNGVSGGNPAPTRPERRGGVPAAGSPNGSPLPRHSLEATEGAKRHSMAGVMYVVRYAPDQHSTSDEPQTRIIWVVDEGLPELRESPHRARFITSLHQQLYRTVAELAADQGFAQPGGGANSAGMALVIPTQHLDAWLQLSDAIHSETVEALMLQLGGMIREARQEKRSS
jgi:hypothetical protein